MKLSERIKRRFQPIDYVEPPKFKRPPRTNAPMQPQRCAGEIPTPPPFPPKPQPSKLLRILRGFAPQPPVYDYTHFELTNLFKAMTKQSMGGQIRMIVDCFDSDDNILVDELIEWKPWLRAQGIKIEFIDEPPISSEDYVKYYVISWGEN